jgi:phenylacetic acid degradation operon negative regulatory protein
MWLQSYTCKQIIATMRESTRTALFALFVMTGRRLTAPQVIALAEPLGIAATNVKSHLSRMVAEGVLQRRGGSRRATYWPAARQRRVMDGISRRLGEGTPGTWNGRWIMLALRLPAGRSQRDRWRNELWFDGFRPWTAGTWLRPEWPEEWAASRAEIHLARGGALALRGNLIGALDVRRVREMYTVDVLDRQARQLMKAIAALGEVRSERAALRLRLTVGGRVARLVAHDPRLPREIWGRRTGFVELVRAYGRFERRIAPLSDRFVEQVLREPTTAP